MHRLMSLACFIVRLHAALMVGYISFRSPLKAVVVALPPTAGDGLHKDRPVPFSKTYLGWTFEKKLPLLGFLTSDVLNLGFYISDTFSSCNMYSNDLVFISQHKFPWNTCTTWVTVLGNEVVVHGSVFPFNPLQPSPWQIKSQFSWLLCPTNCQSFK